MELVYSWMVVSIAETAIFNAGKYFSTTFQTTVSEIR